MALLPAYLRDVSLQPALPPAPPPPPPPPPPPVMKECCICFDEKLRDELHLLSPCGHRCVCAACAALLLARPAASRACPTGRWRARRAFGTSDKV
jgi:hypothetical protein